MAAVLITVQNGLIDYVSDGDCNVVVVDYDSFDPDTSFPEDYEVAIDQVLGLPQTIGWRGGTIRRLNEMKAECARVLLAGPGYTVSGNIADDPGADKFRQEADALTEPAS